jgi:SAM-dependent methyltransferase
LNDAFLKQCNDYLQKLHTSTGLDSTLKLWRETSLPYAMPEHDPFSDEYRREVMKLYSNLTSGDYQVQNELTSTKQDAAQFELGYPWVSQNLNVICGELGKTIQAMKTIGAGPARPQRIVEFGCGWGNLLIPLLRSGQLVTGVDIDLGFLNRIKSHVEREHLSGLEIIHDDFLQAASKMQPNFDAAVFMSSFHHCLEFDDLLAKLESNVLARDGRLLFFAEPVFRGYPFPWGLRFDGESLWAIMCNKWLELGFEHDFFVSLLLSHGFLLSEIPAIPEMVGPGFEGTRAHAGQAFAATLLPHASDITFWPGSGDPAHGRFLRSRSVLPRISFRNGTRYRLEFSNFGTQALSVSLRGDTKESSVVIPPGALVSVDAPISKSMDLSLHAQTFVPHQQIQNNDFREIGPVLLRLSII